jgi:hypothetical protein
MAVTFDAMPIGKRAQWLDWAKSHDWGETARYVEIDGKTVMRVEFDERDELGYWGKAREFPASPQELRALAGY